MRTATTVEASGAPWGETVDFVTEAERIGLDECWVAEAWGSDAPSALGFLAARTSRIRLGSGIMQVGTRSPVLPAQTALTLADVSQGRFALGGLHGVPFAHPLGRTREIVAVIRSVFAGERVAHDGRHVRIPLSGGDGRPQSAAAAR